VSKALVVYDSIFGNTEKLAKALATGLESGRINAVVLKVDAVKFDELGSFDLLCVGSPTHAWNASKATKEFLEHLKGVNGLGGKKAFAFDTKMKSRLAGEAAGKIEKKLKDAGFTIMRNSKSVVVKGREGPLEEGAEEMFKNIGAELAKEL
jgi:flavorubredoxin